jgi:hypothetical protein
MRCSLVQCHWRTSLVCNCIILPYLIKFRNIHRTDVVTGAKLPTRDVPRTPKTAAYPHTRWDVQFWQRMSWNLLHRRNFSNYLECLDCPRILDLHCHLLELIMSSSVRKKTFITLSDFTACCTEWGNMKFFMASFAKSVVTCSHILACLFIFTQPSFACLSLVSKKCGTIEIEDLKRT